MLSLLPLLLACSPKAASPYNPSTDDREDADACDYTDPEIVDFGGWEGASSSGATASDWLGFALGPWSLEWQWDDGSSSTLEMQGEPDGAVQAVAGPDDKCTNPLMADGRYRFESTDGRFELELDFTWVVENPAGSLDLGSVVVETTLPSEDLAVDPLEPGSTARLRALIGTDGDIYVGLSEEWTDAEGLQWRCTRATTDDTVPECTSTAPGKDTGMW